MQNQNQNTISSPHQSIAKTPSNNNSNTSSSSSNFQNSSSISYTSLYQSHSPPLKNQRLSNATALLEYQQLYNRYTTCLGYLTDLFAESENLRIENEALRLTNVDLANRVEALLAGDRILADLDRLKIVSESFYGGNPKQLLNEFNRVEKKVVERVSNVPKSISVRSKGYLDVNRFGRDQQQVSVTQPSATAQKVYVPLQGAQMEEEAVELDVFNQGMLKTELCNKWEETGACPYGENCQFAHGIKELRPVLRHPRYKTELCRMVLAGDVCPYGHRCHFRHSLTEQERLIASQQPTV